jgi:G:T-mismatch repair DNA endonuclease (very short patch repair protein)
MNDWTTQVASDVQRDGLGLELLRKGGIVVADVFRCDADNSVSVTCFEE